MADIRINALATTATSAASDDYLALDGSANGTRKILATNVAQNVTDVTLGSAGPSVKSTLSARAPRQGLVFDGTAGATFGGVNFGSSDFTVSVWISVNSLSGNNVIIDSIGGGNNFALYVATDGSIRRLDRSTSTTASTAAGVISVGKTYLVTYVRGAFYINGVLQNTFSDTSNYSTSMARIGWAASSDSFCTGLLVPLIYNRALSASEVVALYEAGAPAGADYNNASNTSAITGAWTKASGSGTVTSTSVDNIVISASGNLTAISTQTISVSKGQKVRLAGSWTGLSGTINCYLYTTGLASNVASVTATGAELTATETGTPYLIIETVGAAGATGASVAVARLGLLLAPDAAQAGGGLTWYDTSGNAANITLPASGVSWNVPFAGYLTAPTTTNLTLNGGSSGASLVLQQGTTGDAVFSNSANTGFIVGANNATSGTGAFSALGLLAGTRQSFIYRFSEGYSSSGYYVAGALVFENNGTAGHMIFADAGSESMRITATNRNLLIGTTTDGGQKLQVSGTAAISGALSIGNTVQTAVSVASTHKVTISIGGSTYYLLATNV